MIKLSITTKEVNRVAQKVTSTDIKLVLKEFHNGKPSYFITECKTCSTYFPDPQGLLKFDGLAITKSYVFQFVNVCSICVCYYHAAFADITGGTVSDRKLWRVI